MAWSSTPDNYDHFRRHQAKQDRWLESRPICSVCGEPIQDERLCVIDDEPVCMDCFKRDYIKRTEDYTA